MIYAGIDIGSITAKAALIRENQLLGTHVILAGYNPLNAGIKVFETLLEKMKVSKSDVKAIVSTAYARATVNFDAKPIPEI